MCDDLESILLRPAGPGDELFLRAVYASTRAEELAVLAWDESARDAFLAMQFHAQHQHYHTYFPSAAFDLILVAGVPAGRLYVDRSAAEWLLIDIALLPTYRGRGIGTCLLRDLLEEAAAAERPVRLHVEPNNPARRLYERLGFKAVAEQGFRLLLEWAPPPDTSKSGRILMQNADDTADRPSLDQSRRAFIRGAAGVLLGGALLRSAVDGATGAAAAGIATPRSPLHPLSHAALSAHHGRRFRVTGGTAEAVQLQLIELSDPAPSVTRASRGGPPPGGEQFTLVFRGPRNRPLAPSIYTFHPDSSRAAGFALFIAPATADRDGQRYIATINRHAEQAV